LLFENFDKLAHIALNDVNFFASLARKIRDKLPRSFRHAAISPTQTRL
jgi:exonuclease I